MREAAHVIPARIPSALFTVVGDSTSTRFDGLMLEHPSGAVAFKARWQPVSMMRDVFHGGKLSEYLTRILMEMRYVRRTPDTHWPFPRLPERIDGGEGPAFNYEPRNAGRCVLLFSYGESDLFQLGHHYAPGFDERSAARAFQSRCEPLFEAIQMLKRIGYSNVFLHGITPPTKFEEAPWPPYAVRFKLARIGKEVFERFAEQTGTGLITIWDDISRMSKGAIPGMPATICI